MRGYHLEPSSGAPRFNFSVNSPSSQVSPLYSFVHSQVQVETSRVPPFRQSFPPQSEKGTKEEEFPNHAKTKTSPTLHSPELLQ